MGILASRGLHLRPHLFEASPLNVDGVWIYLNWRES
jgi:hypothetical protein